MIVNLDEKTRIPLFVAIASLPVLIVSTFWLATLSSRVSATEERANRVVDKINLMEMKEEKTLDLMIDIRERLVRIETKLNK